MSEPKPFASLGPTLLARKGGARPAMRPQYHSFPGFERNSANHAEDLGWNDMGEEHVHENGQLRESGDVLALTPMSGPDDGIVEEAPKPTVRLQQEEIARQLETASPPAAAVRPRATTKRRSALDDGRRAAFTLRVDAERHLKLRLACTIRNKSAQQLVTEALDLLLDNMTDLENLAAQVKRR